MTSATELLRKYAADGAAQPDRLADVKFNLKRIPLKGERAQGYGAIDDSYVDKWWEAYDKENATNPTRLNRAEIERQQGELENAYKEKLEQHRRPKFQWWNPVRWLNPFRSNVSTFIENGTVDKAWLAEEAARPFDYTEVNQHGAPELLDMERRIRSRTLFNDDRAKEYRQNERRLTGAMHMTGQVLDAATMGLGANWYTKKVTGEGISDLASSYGRLYAQDDPEGAYRAEQLLRLGGFAARLPVDLAWMAVAKKIPGNVATGHGGLLPAGARPAGLLPGATAAASNAGVMARLSSFVDKGKTIAGIGKDMALFGAQAYPMVYGMHKPWATAWHGAASATRMAFGQDSGLGAVTAGLMDFCGIYEDFQPGAKMLGAYASGLSRLPAVASSAPMRLFTNMSRWAGKKHAWWNLPAQYAKFTVNMLPWTLYGMSADAVNSVRNGQLPLVNPLRLVDPTGLLLPQADSILTGHNDTYAAFRRRGSGQAEYNRYLEEVSADPAGFKQATAGLAAMYGIDASKLSDEEYVNAMAPNMYASLLSSAAQTAIDRELAPDFDWEGASPYVAEAKRKSFAKQDVQRVKSRVYRDILSAGGPVDYSMLADADLTAEQRKDLLSQYLKAEYFGRVGIMAKAEDLALAATPLPMFKLDDRLRVSHVMDSSEHARKALVAYGSSVVLDRIAGKYDGENDPLAAAVVRNMTPEERQEMLMMPIMSSTPEQLANFTASGGGMVNKELAAAAEPLLKLRIENDRNFAADYVLKMCDNLNSGANLSDADIDAGVRMLESVDLDSLLDSTDPDRLMKLYRVIGSEEGRQKLAGLGPAGTALLARFKDVMPQYVMNAALRDPLHNLPALAGLWLQSKNYGGAASAVSNPFVFYSMAALLLFGGFSLFGGLFGGSGDGNDAASLMTRRKQQAQDDDWLASLRPL